MKTRFLTLLSALLLASAMSMTPVRAQSDAPPQWQTANIVTDYVATKVNGSSGGMDTDGKVVYRPNPLTGAQEVWFITPALKCAPYFSPRDRSTSAPRHGAQKPAYISATQGHGVQPLVAEPS